MTENLQNMSETIIFPPNSIERILPQEGSAGKPLRERYVGMTAIGDFQKPYEVLRITPKWHVVLFTVKGRAGFRTMDAKGELRPGTVWIGPAGCRQHYFASGKWRVLWFHLHDTERWAFLKQNQSQLLPSTVTARMENAMEGYLAETIASNSDSTGCAQAYAEIIGTYLERTLSCGDTAAKMRLRHEIQLLLERVSQDLRHSWSTDELAGELHISVVHFHRLVSDLYNSTPMKMVTGLRMRRAQSLLRNSSYPVYMIADMVGYKTTFAFSRAFARYAGCSPRAYRCQHPYL